MKNRRSFLRKRAVVLLSGGLDSATTLYLARQNGFRTDCLIFDYGQRHKKEIESARRIAQSAGCKAQIVKIKLPWKGSALLDGKIKIPLVTKSVRKPPRRGQSQCASLPGGDKVTSKIPSTYVPGRNIIFLSFALSFAEAIKAKAIFIGAHIQDYSGYPDCRPEFLRAFDKVISCGTKSGAQNERIKIHAPLIRKNKLEIIRLAVKLGVPLGLTRSCYRGGKIPCGKCDSCYFRAKGFLEAGIDDPALK